MYFLYSVALGLALLLTLPYWLARMLTQGKYRAGLAGRLGRVPQRLRSPGPGCIWIHAVSVGEVLAISRLVNALREQFPSQRVVISTTTATGQKLARERFGEENVFYFPLDFAFAIRPYFRALRPELVVLAETEFWPNFLRIGRQSGAHVAVVNARISDRSLPRYLRLRSLWRRVLRGIDVFLTQSEEDQRRLVAIGAAPDRVRVTGNLKFDITAPRETPLVATLRQKVEGPVLVCGSTVEGEESLLLEAFRPVLARYPGALLVLAPRHPERFGAVADLLVSHGVKFWRRSQLPDNEALAGGVLLLDSIGELAAIYGLATLAFVGGSLVPHGGHNILEPAQHGVPVLVGPHTENFRDIVNTFQRHDAVVIVQPQELAREFLRLLDDTAACAELGLRAVTVSRAHAGATGRTLAAISNLLDRREAPAAAPAAVEAVQ
ncbi:MAG TPA: 3-deoxy-D-manno-octulosonic acid transferase [Terriglobales bacterium]|nr:3-deoxy-D-manno-octulosonic acid transferase [Terriglobales bacterium]